LYYLLIYYAYDLTNTNNKNEIYVVGRNVKSNNF